MQIFNQSTSQVIIIPTKPQILKKKLMWDFYLYTKFSSVLHFRLQNIIYLFFAMLKYLKKSFLFSATFLWFFFNLLKKFCCFFALPC